ncbi:MAG: flagellar assembly protein FliW [Bacillota bacterium]|nr:flagellar assembly protein FliW [Candidatus Fermentithermobacillaceae bacterium]
MEVPTKRFGIVEVDESRILHFPEGLIGFPDYRRFIVLDLDKGGFLKWLQSVDEESLGFVIIDPRVPFVDYDPVFAPGDLQGLGACRPDELVLMSVVTVPGDAKEMTANLLAPLLINPEKRLGRQVIVSDPKYTTKHQVFAALQDLMKRTG